MSKLDEHKDPLKEKLKWAHFRTLKKKKAM